MSSEKLEMSLHIITLFAVIPLHNVLPLNYCLDKQIIGIMASNGSMHSALAKNASLQML